MHNPPITNDPALKISYYMKHVVRSDWSEYNLNFDELSKRLLVVSREFGMRKAISTKSLTGDYLILLIQYSIHLYHSEHYQS
jgi:hypothetical protein